MSDRSDCKLSVLKRHETIVSNLIRCTNIIEDENGIVTFHIEEAKNGQTGYEWKLQDQKIPYDLEWEAGCEYTAGTQSFRIFADGTTQFVEQFEDDATFGVGDLGDIKSLLEENNPVAALNLINDKINGVVKNEATFSLMKQEQYLTSHAS